MTGKCITVVWLSQMRNFHEGCLKCLETVANVMTINEWAFVNTVLELTSLVYWNEAEKFLQILFFLYSKFNVKHTNSKFK